MKRFYHVTFWVLRAERDQYYRLLEDIDCLKGWREASPLLPQSNHGFDLVFEAGDPRLAKIRALQRRVQFWTEMENLVYDDAELREFPFLWLWFSGRTVGGGGPEYGTEYDVSKGCPSCGTGAVQTSPLRVASAELPKKGLFCETHQDHVLAGEELATALRKAGVSGLELRQARSHRGNKPLPWWQMIGTCTMPRMSPKTKGMVRDTRPGWGCPKCQRDGYGMEQPVEITYERRQANPAELPDVVQTWECFGRSVLRDDPERELGQGFAQPLLLFNAKVFDIFREFKVKQVEFQPIRIVG